MVDEPGEGRDHDRGSGGVGSGDADDQTARGDESVVGAKDRGAKPADVSDPMTFDVAQAEG